MEEIIGVRNSAKHVRKPLLGRVDEEYYEPEKELWF